MSLVYLFTGFATGVVVGIGGAFLLLRWRLKRQLGQFQSDMEDMMDMTGEMGEAFDDMEESIETDFEEVDGDSDRN